MRWFLRKECFLFQKIGDWIGRVDGSVMTEKEEQRLCILRHWDLDPCIQQRVEMFYSTG